MSARIKLWGAELTLETIKLDITAVGEGWTVTASAIIEDGSEGGAVLCSITKPLSRGSADEALDSAGEVARMVRLWIEAEGGEFLPDEA